LIRKNKNKNKKSSAFSNEVNLVKNQWITALMQPSISAQNHVSQKNYSLSEDGELKINL
jgi:hypothetical protein